MSTVDISYIYIIRCEDNSLYTGVTKDIPKRMSEHYYQKKQGAKYTKSRQAVELMMVWQTESWSGACKLEYYIKSLTRSKKCQLIQCPDLLSKDTTERLREYVYIPKPQYCGMLPLQ